MVSESLNAVSSVESSADLFISLDKSLKFCIKLNVLAGKNIAVVLEGIDLSSVVSVCLLH